MPFELEAIFGELMDGCGCDEGFEIFDRPSAEADLERYQRARTGHDHADAARHDPRLAASAERACSTSARASASSTTSCCARAPATPCSSTPRAPSLEAARNEARRRGHLDRLDFVDGDFVSRASAIDAGRHRHPRPRRVLLSRTWTSLVAPVGTRAHARCTAWSCRATGRSSAGGLRLLNVWFRIRGMTYRSFAHPNDRVDAIVAEAGLAARAARRTTFFWRVVLYERAPAGQDCLSDTPDLGALVSWCARRHVRRSSRHYDRDHRPMRVPCIRVPRVGRIQDATHSRHRQALFGTRARPPRPVLLILVYGAFLAIVGAAATAQSVLVGAHFSTATLTGLVGSDAATIRAFVNAYVPPADLSPATPPPAAEVARLEAQLATLPRPGEILRVELRRPDGTIVAASEPGLARRRRRPASGEFGLALGGTPQAAIGPGRGVPAPAPATFASPTLLREFLPLERRRRGPRRRRHLARRACPILERLDGMRREIVIVTLSAGLVAAGLLFLVFRSAQAAADPPDRRRSSSRPAATR